MKLQITESDINRMVYEGAKRILFEMPVDAWRRAEDEYLMREKLPRGMERIEGQDGEVIYRDADGVEYTKDEYGHFTPIESEEGDMLEGSLNESGNLPDDIQNDFTNWAMNEADTQRRIGGPKNALGLMYDYYFNNEDSALYELVDLYKEARGLDCEEDSQDDIWIAEEVRRAINAWGYYCNLNIGDENADDIDLEEENEMGEGEPEGIQYDKYYYIRSGSSHVIDLKMKGEYINMCCHPGNCDGDVTRVIELPEVKSQLDAIDDAQLDAWWNEFFCDDTPEEHAAADRNTKLMWLVFDACCSAIDGDYEEAYDDSDDVAMLKEAIEKIIRESFMSPYMNNISHGPYDMQEKGGTKKSRHSQSNMHYKTNPKTGRQKRAAKRAIVIKWLKDPSVNCAEIMRQLWNPSPEDEDTKRGEFYKKRDGAINKQTKARYSFSDDEINTLYMIKSNRT